MMPDRYPSLRIRFSINGYYGECVALVDTGCDVGLVVPRSLVPGLSAPNQLIGVSTASGEKLEAPAYAGTAELFDEPTPVGTIILVLGDECLVGLPMLNHFRVTLDHGQRIIVEP